MGKWEYCCITWTTSTVSDDAKQEMQKSGFEGTFYKEDNGDNTVTSGFLLFLKATDSPQEFKPITGLSSNLARLGIEGWELVSHTETRQLGTIQETYYLKRQIQD